MKKNPYIGTVGFLIEADCGVDLAEATETVFRVRKPSGAEVTWPATPAALDGVTRLLRYPTKPGDLNEPGVYRIHACLTLGNWSGPGEVGRLTVRELFEKN